MTTLPAASITADEEAAPRASFLQRARTAVVSRMGYALADQVAYSFGNMVVMALMSRYAGAREFGMYMLTQRAMDILIQLCNVGLWAPYNFNMPAMAEPRRRVYTGSIVAQQLIACVLGAGLLWFATLWSKTPARGLYYGVFAPLILTSFAILFREFTRRMYFAHMRFRAAFWTDFATVALQVAGIAYLYRMHTLSVPRVLFALSLGAGLVSIYWLVTEFRTFTVDLRTSLHDFRSNSQLGRWLLGSNMIFTVSSQCNPWLISALLGAPAVGIYSVCESVVNIPRVALTSVQNVMGPTSARALAADGKPGLRRTIARFDRMLTITALLFAVLIVTCGPWVMSTLFKKQIGGGHAILLLLALNFIAFSMTLAQSYGLTALNRASLTFYANVNGLVAQIAVSVWLIHAFGIAGAAASMLVGSAAVVAVRQYFYKREIATA